MLNMHHVLTALKGGLEAVVQQVRTVVPNDEPLGNAHSNWSFPGITRAELAEEAQALITFIDTYGQPDLGGFEARLSDYIRRLQHLQQHTIPQLWGNAGQAVPAYLITLGGLKKVLDDALKAPDVTSAELVKRSKTVTSQLKGLEARLNGLGPRTELLNAMVQRIESASSAADQLPQDLESLEDARKKIAALFADAGKDQKAVAALLEQAKLHDEALAESQEEAKVVLARCESAYSAATSVGLAAAFTERSESLTASMWVWVVGLVLALGAGGYYGSTQLHSLAELLKTPNPSTFVVVLNLMLSLFSVGAPVWFAWLSTKQVGQRFKLAEDYAYKASIARAYEGFRRETARFDKDMEARLLTSALARLDELPLRLVEQSNHGSPWHELLSSDVVKQAVRAVPNFADQVKDLAGKAVATVASKIPDVTVKASVPAEKTNAE